jgi:hypothetical protein
LLVMVLLSPAMKMLSHISDDAAESC